jgi:hypothetical protein
MNTVPIGNIVEIQPTNEVKCIALQRQKYRNPSKKTKVVYNLQLGSTTGTVKMIYDAKGAKDRFVLNWNGQDVINTGCVKNKGEVTFSKSLPYPTTATLTITTCEGGSSGFIQVNCPI